MTTTAINRSPPLPRYTSYPPANCWDSLSSFRYSQALANVKAEPISLYIHIPFCDKRCLFCGCFTIPSKNRNVKESYLEYLKKEISLFKSTCLQSVKVVQIHLGGGTPTSLSSECLHSLVKHIETEFDCAENRAVAIEIDPRTIHSREDLQKIRDLGFNRISLGVQDFDTNVQRAIGRIQPVDQVEQVVLWAKSMQFEGINMDLIYGLPYQTVTSFGQTLDTVIRMNPDRIALFAFAFVPEIRSHQENLPIDAFPSVDEKMKIFTYAKEMLEKAGYISIGMDHFCKPQDALALAYANQTLTRNFQGYDLGLAKSLVGFGVSAISSLQEGYFQNTKDLALYQHCIDENQLPIVQGYIFSGDDLIRKWTISKIMCGYILDKKQFLERFSLEFDEFFQKEIEELKKTIPNTYFVNRAGFFEVTNEGKFFLREISNIFDSSHWKKM